MKCPKCNTEILFLRFKCKNSIEVKEYECQDCGILYERHTFHDQIGLVKEDKLYELTENGIILRGW